MTQKPAAFLVKVNDVIFSFDNEMIENIDVTKTAETRYHLLHHHLSVNAEVSSIHGSNKKMKVEIDGDIFVVEIKEELDQMLDQMGFGKAANKQIKEIKAPMPGLVLEINVQAGDAVTQGSKLLILEAMKMENSIMIPVDATIKKVNVTKGQAVDKGEVLVELE